MRTAFRMGMMIGAALLLATAPAWAQDKPKAKKKAPKPAPAEVAAATEDGPAEAAIAAPETPAAIPESTPDLCIDKTDNDADGFADCADQDCQIFAVCVRPIVVAAPAPEPPPPPPPPAFVPREERGRMCGDGLDNDRDGLVDCFEKSCHATWRCQREIYYRPRDPKRAPGLLVSFGGGIAAPNFRGNGTHGQSGIYGEVPFRSDVGGLLNLSLGVLPVRWFGVGINLMVSATEATNRYSDWDDRDNPNDPNYEAYKVAGHVGGFLRFQLPFDRFVPYLNVSGGYTYAEEHWDVYSGAESWDNIDTYDAAELDYAHDDDARYFRHFSLAVEPGFDVFLADRFFAVGLRAWLPVWATSHPDVDNVGVMLSFTFTPMWREAKRLKPEYENPASTLEEEQGREVEPPAVAAPPLAPTAPAADPYVPPPPR
jgi:hypothetical protein